MNRRQLLGRLAAVAGVAALASAVVTVEARLSESRAYGDPAGVPIRLPDDALTVTGEAMFAGHEHVWITTPGGVYPLAIAQGLQPPPLKED